MGVNMGSYTTRAVSKNEYKKIIDTLRAGYFFKGVQHKPNEKIATILIIERNLGVRLSDVIKLKKEDIVKEGDHYRLDIVEQKTGKKRFYTVPTPVRDFIYTYAEEIGVEYGRLFKIGEAAVWKAVREVAAFLGLKNVNTHSIRKSAGVELYEQTGYDIEMVREFFQHASISTTQIYIKATPGKLTNALNQIVDLG